VGGGACVLSKAETREQALTVPDAGPKRMVDAPAAMVKAPKAGAGGRMEEAVAKAGAGGSVTDSGAQPSSARPKVDASMPAPSVDAEPPAMPTACSAIDKLDLLLMVDNSNSMAGEQASLKKVFPRLIEALTSGLRFPGDMHPFPPVQDLHVGIVSSDMGIPGVELPPSCHANGGDDGRLLHAPHGEGCEPGYPQWLSFQGKDSAKFVMDMGCIASLGTGGCGFEQQLESPLKALWPRHYKDLAGNEVLNPLRFLSTSIDGTQGRGDVPEAEGGNLGFLRPATDASPSLLVILAVTDEDDCSVKSTEHLKPNNQLPENSPYRAQDINLRCLQNPQFLYDIKARYYGSLRALRPNAEDRVMFAAIAGVPPELVAAEALEKVDFEAADPGSRSAFYDAILSDARMQQVVDPTTMPGSGQGNLTASCKRMVAGDTFPSTAYPPRRIVELAKLFDQNSMVQSICQDDFTQPIFAIIQMIARKLTKPCGSSSP
jgi:hypothetical protein